MNLTELTIRLLILFFPGVVCFLIVEALTVHRERKTHEVLFFTFVHGVLCYLIYFVVRMPFGFHSKDESGSYWTSPTPVFFKCLTDSKSDVSLPEIGWVAFIAVGLAFVWSYLDKKKSLHKLAKWMRVTNKFGEPNVWSHIFNLDDVRWCVVRDLPRKLMFQGWVLKFSDVEDVAEVFLDDVHVYNEETGDLLYRAEQMLLSRKRDDLTIEIQTNPNQGGASNEGTDGSKKEPDRRVGEEGRSESAATGQRDPATQSGGQQAVEQRPVQQHTTKSMKKNKKHK